MRFTFGIGDYSDDGHGRCDSYACDVEGAYSIPEIKEAYEKSKAELGFGLEDIATEYASGMDESQAEDIVDFGLVAPQTWDLSETTLAETIMDDLDEEVWLLIFEMMVKKHLPSFKATLIKDPIYPSLFGEWGSEIIKHEHIGYGVKGN